ncbi:MAG: prepilin peptidase, partial [Nitrospinae bacterium]|nr:prepilin peptidase [Nitrospinota bacterium]
GGAILGLAVSFLLPVGFTGALAGMLVGGGIFFALAILYPGGMGGGDIKLMGAIGAFLGWKLALVTIIISSVIGAAVGGFAMLFFGKGRKDRIPFGPFLALGGVMALLFGDALIAWYFERVVGGLAY